MICRPDYPRRNAQVSRRFPLGRLLSTPAALAALANARQLPTLFLSRHARGDWGDVSAADAKANDDALAEGGRLLSAYVTSSGDRIWIITEADRSATTILLPSEY